MAQKPLAPSNKRYRRRRWHPTPVLLPGKSHGWRGLVGCSPRGRKESDRTERLPFHFSLSCIGEGNGNPPHCSCLENPRDGGAWWAAIYGVTQSRTRLKRLSSSSWLRDTWRLNNHFILCIRDSGKDWGWIGGRGYNPRHKGMGAGRRDRDQANTYLFILVERPYSTVKF